MSRKTQVEMLFGCIVPGGKPHYLGGTPSSGRALGSPPFSQPFAERSRSELTTHWGSLGFDSAQPTELDALQFQSYLNGRERWGEGIAPRKDLITASKLVI